MRERYVRRLAKVGSHDGRRLDAIYDWHTCVRAKVHAGEPLPTKLITTPDIARARLVLRKFRTSLLPPFLLPFFSPAFQRCCWSTFEGRDRFAAGRVSRGVAPRHRSIFREIFHRSIFRERKAVALKWRREGRRSPERSRNEIVTFQGSYIAGDCETAYSDCRAVVRDRS